MRKLLSLCTSRRQLCRFGIVTLLLVALWLLTSLLVVYILTRRAHAPFAQPAPTVGWGTFEEHRLETSDGKTLGAWFLRGKPERPVVLWLHGHRGNRGNGLHSAQFYNKQQ